MLMFAPVPPAPEPTPEEVAEKAADQKLDDAYTLANDYLDQNKDVEEIIHILEERGLRHEEAVALVSEVVMGRAQVQLVHSKAYRKALRNAGERNMLIGLLLFVVGAIASIGSYAAAAAQRGGTYTVAAGAIIFGAIGFFRGLRQVLQANRLKTDQ
jgi:hypothetical protein